MISRKLQYRRRISRGRLVAPNAVMLKSQKIKPSKRVSKKKEQPVYQAKFIEVLDEKIMKQVELGKMNKNVNAQDKKYLTQLNKYKPSKRTGINVGDILYIEGGGDREWSCYLALPGKLQWLGDDGDTYDFILNLSKYRSILEAHKVKYSDLFKNTSYYELNKNGLEQKPGLNWNIDEYLLGSVIERDTPARIMQDLADSQML